MRSIIVFTLLFFCSIQSIFTQPEPITIQFVEAQPIWEHLVWDTSFYTVVPQPGLNKYTTVQAHHTHRFKSDLIISNRCLNYNAEIYGYVLEALDIETGQVKWQTYNTYYNNGMQDFYRNLYLRPDGNLEMIGIKRNGPYIDSILGYWNVGGGKSNFVRKVFNYNTGNLMETTIGQDIIGHIVPHYLEFFPIQFDSTYLVLNLDGEEVNDTLIYGYEFYQLNHQHNLVDSLPISTILYETSDLVNVFGYGQPQYTQKLDDTTLLGLIFQDKTHPGKMKAQLIWINIKDIENIKVIKRINIESFIPDQQPSFLFFNLKVANNLIYISQPYKDSILDEYITFLTCLDRDGNLIHYIPKCIESNNIYINVNLIYSGDHYDYYAAFPSRTGRKGFDILKLNRDSDSFQYISSLTSAHLDENFALQMEISDLYDDGLFVIGAYTEKLGPVLNSAVKYYCFHGSDLGMELSTSVKNEVTDDEIIVYPNPSTGIVNFRFNQVISGHIKIFDLTGRELAFHTFCDLELFQINLQNYPNGIYYACIINDNSAVRQVVKIIVSTEGN